MAAPFFSVGEFEPIRAKKLNEVEGRLAAVEAGGGGGGAGVSSFNTRTGAVTLTSADVTGALAFTPLRPNNNLSDLSNAGTARTNLGLGTAATQATTAFAAASHIHSIANVTGLQAALDTKYDPSTVNILANPAAGQPTGMGINNADGSFVRLKNDADGKPGYVEWAGPAAADYGYVGWKNANNRHDFATAIPVEFNTTPYVGSVKVSLESHSHTITLTGDVTGTGTGSFAASIGAHKVTRGMLAAAAGATLLGATGAGDIADLTAAQAKTFLAISAGDVSGLSAMATSTDAANLTGTLDAARIASGSLALTKLANIADQTILGNNAGSAGPPIALTAAQTRTVLGLATVATSGSASDLGSGTLPAGRMPALTGDVTTAGGALATTIAADVVDNSKLANMVQSTIKGRAAGAGTGDPTDLTAAQVKTLLAIAAGDVSGLASIATSGSGADLANGTVSPAKLSFTFGNGLAVVSSVLAGSFTALPKTGAYAETATSGEVIAFCNLFGGFTVSLPVAAGNAAKLTFKNLRVDGPITIAAAGTDTIDGNASIILSTQYAAVSLVSDGVSAWGII